MSVVPARRLPVPEGKMMCFADIELEKRKWMQYEN